MVNTWEGYLAGLLEWGVLDIEAYGRLIDGLPTGDRRALVEIALGEYADEIPSCFERPQDQRKHAWPNPIRVVSPAAEP